MEKDTIYWHLPGLCAYGMMNHVLLDAMKKFPNMFRDNYKIGSVYGTFPCAIWNGGRNLLDGFSNKRDVEKIIKSYNDYNIPARFTWTNVLLEEKHVYDTYCNMIMNVGDNGMNQVLVNSQVLEDYIRENYPKYKILSSTTKRIISVDRLLEELEKDYFLVVLDYDLNHNSKVIEKILPYAERIEILVNETCQPHCPRRAAHYKEISKFQLEFDSRIKFLCTDPNPEKKTFKGCMKTPAFMTTSDVEKYSEMGFKNFKIVGRGEGQQFYLDSIIYYLVKPEHRDFIFKHITETMNFLRSGQPIRGGQPRR